MKCSACQGTRLNLTRPHTVDATKREITAKLFCIACGHSWPVTLVEKPKPSTDALKLMAAREAL